MKSVEKAKGFLFKAGRALAEAYEAEVKGNIPKSSQINGGHNITSMMVFLVGLINDNTEYVVVPKSYLEAVENFQAKFNDLRDGYKKGLVD